MSDRGIEFLANRRNRKQTPKSAKRRRRLALMEALEDRRLLTVSTFQQGVAGYAGQQDTVLYSREPDQNFGTEGSISPDQQDANGVRQGLVRFDDIIGDTGNRIPLGAKINSATLVVDVINDSNSAMQMSLYRMQQNWDESLATWNSFGQIGGVQASEGEASNLPPDAILFDPDTSANSPTAGRFDVKRSLEYWAAGENNYGWLFESASTNGWDFRTKEAAISERPRLTVDWSIPSAVEYQILNTSVISAEGNAGATTTAMVEVARLGDLTAASSITYSIAAGTASTTDFVAVPNGTLNFAANQGFATIPVTINGDDALEGLETITVTLTSGNIVAGRGSATVTISDDDALINEVLANVTNSDDETDREYIELIGTPSASLNGYYFVVFEGEEEEGGPNGVGAGIADFVVNLSPFSFGSNGLLVLAPTNWEYASAAAAGTNVVPLAALDGAGGVLEDSSQTYALIRSPNAPIVQGTDYDTVGIYEVPTNQAIGQQVYILDQLPAGADMVDSVGVVEGGGGDRDRTLTTQLLDHPGVHVHQPTPFTPGGNVTSDAVSRRFGQRLPNSIGAWFNGDISDGTLDGASVAYENDSFFISVVAPDGSELTPGAPNILRTVYFSVADQDKEVAEADGSVTLRIERTGGPNEPIFVTYRTVDFGSATEGLDYVGVNETINFGPNENFKDITITILPDSVAEGFERFRVEITDVTAGYQITDGRANLFGAVNGEAVVTIADANVSTKTFQNGVDGYSGTFDAYLDGEQINSKFGQDPVIRVDQVKGEGEDTPSVVRPQQGLIRFDNMFGSAANQVPAGSTIFGGFLTVNVTNVSAGADIRFFRMLQDWEEVNATWTDPQGNRGSSILNGVTPDDVEASADVDARVPNPGRAGLVEIPLDADTLQAWSNGSLPNYGWSIVSDSGSLWAFNSSEAFLTGTFRPELTILYTDPVPGDAGTFSLAADDFYVNEDGTTATVTVNRFGGFAAASVNWQLSAGTASLTSDISGATSGTLSFAANELFKTFTVNITDDVAVEANETLGITLSGSGLTFGRDTATLRIRDNDFDPNAGDLLLNEIFINSPGNDPPHEFVELKGTAGIGLGSLYYIAVEGLIGDRTGAAEKVVDIGAFQNGSAANDGQGYTLLTPDAADFAYNVPAGTTQIDGLGSIGTENVASQNDSTTYFLVKSPTRLTLTEFDYDWNDDGALELPAGVEIVDSVGVRVLGAFDQLYGPGTNRVAFAVNDPDVDAVSRSRNNTTRNSGAAFYGGDLFPAGDDYLLYEPGESFNIPVTGGAMTPGEPNTGNAAESPLVSLQDVVVNPNGSITVSFSAPVTQLTSGDGGTASPSGAGITVTDPSGNVIATIDSSPVVSGLGTSSLNLTFTGSVVVGGALPAGSYRLNFVGNALIGNGRAVDVANDGTQVNGFYSEIINVTATSTGDFNNDGLWDCDDINALTTAIATGSTNLLYDLNSDGSVTIQDVTDPVVGWLAVGGAAPNNVAATGGNAFLTGDANLDGVVDGQDFIVWNSNKFTTNPNWCDGNFNGDSVVDGQDFIAWNQNKFTGSMPIPPATGNDVKSGVERKVDRLALQAKPSAEPQISAPPLRLGTYQGQTATKDVHRTADQVEHENMIDRIFAELT